MPNHYEEEVKEESNMEETPSQQDELITLLTGMGLSAEQSEAVFQTVNDLLSAGGAEEEEMDEHEDKEKTEASKQTAMSKKREMSLEDKVEFLTRRLRRLSRQMREQGQAPAQRKFNTRPEGRSAQEEYSIPAPKLGGTQGRAFEMMNEILKQK